MSPSKEALVREMYDRVINDRDLGAIPGYFKSNVAVHVGTDDHYVGLDKLRESLREEFSVFSGAELKIDDLISAEDRVVTRFTYTATHTGRLEGEAPTGARVRAVGITIFRFEQDLIAEEWEVFDDYALMGQLAAAERS